MPAPEAAPESHGNAAARGAFPAATRAERSLRILRLRPMSTPSDRSRARAGAGVPSALRQVLLGLAVVGLAKLRGRRRDRPPGRTRRLRTPRLRAGTSGRAPRPKPPSRPSVPPSRGRGREADAPTEIPARGWKDILWRVYEEISKDRIVAVAAGVTFYALLALFPGDRGAGLDLRPVRGRRRRSSEH